MPEKTIAFEKEVLLRFQNGKKVEEDEFDILEPYWRIGVIHLGISFTKREVQAKLTESGKKILGV